MHGQRFDHGDNGGGLVFGDGGLSIIFPITVPANPFVPGIIGRITSTSQSSSSSSSATPSTLPLTSSVTSSSSSSASPTSSTPSSTHPSIHSATPTPAAAAPKSSPSIFVSSSGNSVVTVTAIVPASSSSNDTNSGAAVPKSFLENKPLVAGVFTVVGVIALAILILIGTMWIRSSGRRRLNREALDASAFDPSAIVRDDEMASSFEKLRRVDSRGSSGYTHATAGQAGVGRGGYPVAFPAPQSYTQPSQYYGQSHEVSGYNGRFAAYGPPRPLDAAYDRSPVPPYVNVIAPTPSTGSQFGEEISPTRHLSQNMTSPPRRSLLNSPPASPSGPGENASSLTKRPNSYSRTMDVQEMPVASPLPPKFGQDVDVEDDDEGAYGGIDGGYDQEIRRSLKVANQ